MATPSPQESWVAARPALWWLAVALCFIVGIVLRWMYPDPWLHRGHVTDAEPNPPLLVTFADGDCYTRLTRVQHILAGEGPILRFHSWENYPIGMSPSTTAPLDFAILALYPICKIFTKQALDWAGTLVSPVLFAAFFAYILWWSRAVWNEGARLMCLIGLSGFAGCAWATCFSRPDHQSLLFVLIGIALSMEWKRWQDDPHAARWSIAAGLTWGLAAWTSMFEPPIILAVVLVVNLLLRHREQWRLLAAFAAVLVVYLLVEGTHALPIGANAELLSRHSQDLVNWGSSIAELRSLNVETFFMYFSWFMIVFPWIVGRLIWSQKRSHEESLLIILTVLLVVVTVAQQRWVSYAALTLSFLGAIYWQREEKALYRWLVLALLIFGVCGSADSNIFLARANRDFGGAFEEDNQYRLLARSIARRSAESPRAETGIMAPYWIAPRLLYYSGLPIVPSTAHTAIEGIMDSTRFYEAQSWAEADEILQRRQVRWVIMMNLDAPLYQNTLNTILYGPHPDLWPVGSTDPKNPTITQRLFRGGRDMPTRYKLIAPTEYATTLEYDAGK